MTKSLGGVSPAASRLAAAIYDASDFARLPVLADALEDAGCADAELLGHLRGPGDVLWGKGVVLKVRHRDDRNCSRTQRQRRSRTGSLSITPTPDARRAGSTGPAPPAGPASFCAGRPHAPLHVSRPHESAARPGHKALRHGPGASVDCGLNSASLSLVGTGTNALISEIATCRRGPRMADSRGNGLLDLRLVATVDPASARRGWLPQSG